MDINEQRTRASVRLVATNSLWVAGFQGLFGDPCGVEIVAVSVLEALGLKHPEVVLVDSGAFKATGTLRDVLGRFRQTCPHVRLIVIGSDYLADDESDSSAESLYIQRLIQAGARGFIRPSAHPDELTAALSWVRNGSIWAPREVLSRLVQTSQSIGHFSPNWSSHGAGFEVPRLGYERFTPREQQVLRLLVGGKCNREIGHTLGIGPDTVKAHLGRIMRKAGVANRIELTMYALSQGPSPRGRARVVVPINTVCSTKETKKDADGRLPGAILRWVN